MAEATEKPAAPAQAEAAAGHDAPAAKKKPKLLMLLVGGIVLGGAGLGGYVVLAKKSDPGDAAKAADHDDHGDHGGHGDKGKEKDKGNANSADSSKSKTQVIMLPSIIVNIRQSGGTRYLKVTIGLETKSPKVADELKRLNAPLNDFLNEKLSNVAIADVDNTVGRNKLKALLRDGINELLDDLGGYVDKVYFTEFVIQ